MNKTNLILIIITSLLLGGLFGTFITGRMVRHKMDKVQNPEARRVMEHERLVKSLDLTAEQEPVVLPLVDSLLDVHQNLRAKHRLELKASREAGLEALNPHITEKQQKKLKRMWNKKNRRRGNKKRK